MHLHVKDCKNLVAGSSDISPSTDKVCSLLKPCLLVVWSIEPHPWHVLCRVHGKVWSRRPNEKTYQFYIFAYTVLSSKALNSLLFQIGTFTCSPVLGERRAAGMWQPSKGFCFL